MALNLITAPVTEPLLPADVRTRLGLPATVPDGQLTPLIQSIRMELDGRDGWLGRALNTQTWELVYDEFPEDYIKIPLPPLQTVLSVKYYDLDGVEQTWDPVNYTVDIQDTEAWIVPILDVTWPAVLYGVNMVRVRFRAGYGDVAANVPEPLRQLIAEKVNLRRQASRPDPFLRSETSEGVGSMSWSTGGGFVKELEDSLNQRLSLYRVWNVS